METIKKQGICASYIPCEHEAAKATQKGTTWVAA